VRALSPKHNTSQIPTQAHDPRADPPPHALRSQPEAAQQLQEVSQKLAAEMREFGTRGGRPVPSMVKVPDPSVRETSSALVVMRQQVALVEGAAALVTAEVARQQSQAGVGGGGGGGSS